MFPIKTYVAKEINTVENVKTIKIDIISCPSCYSLELKQIASYKCKCIYCLETHLKFLCNKCKFKIEYRKSSLMANKTTTQEELLRNEIAELRLDLKLHKFNIEWLEQRVNRLEALNKSGVKEL
jgi:hypothetical protein